LWDDAGVAGLSTYAGLLGQWSGQLVVPALDDVYMLGVDSPPVPLSRGIRPLYRSYVASGLRAGVATPVPRPLLPADHRHGEHAGRGG
jgi:hypothetical protein